MDLLYVLSGVLCLLEGLALAVGKDFLIFYKTRLNKDEFELKKLYQAECPLFLLDGAGCLLLVVVELAYMWEMILLGALLVTLMFHYRFICGDRYKKK